MQLSNDLVLQKLNELGEGKRVIVKCSHVQDPSTVRSIIGIANKRGDGSWAVNRSASSYTVFPSESFIVFEIAERPRSESRNRVDELEEVDAAVRIPPSQPSAAGEVQAPPPPMRDAVLIEMMKLQQQQNDMFKQMLLTMSSRNEAGFNEHQNRQVQPGGDITTLLRMSDALRGQDNPVWRLAPGLLLPRFLPEKFMIVSMPHLIFKEDPMTGEMIKVPKGTALQAYKAMLPGCKLQFPNQVTIKVNKQQGTKGNEQLSAMTVEGTAGVRAQIERAERVFADLLSRLDHLDVKDLPTTKSEWLTFIDVGVNVLELYATLANGFLKGGAKVSISYSNAISTQGKFDPVKLWTNESSSASESFLKH